MAKKALRFADAIRRQDHFRRHGRGIGAKTVSQYERAAAAFLSAPAKSNVYQKSRSNGDLIRYNPLTQEFGILSSAGWIRTYYIPKPAIHGYPSNLDYYHAQ